MTTIASSGTRLGTATYLRLEIRRHFFLFHIGVALFIDLVHLGAGHVAAVVPLTLLSIDSNSQQCAP